jgi:hypothetical protein
VQIFERWFAVSPDGGTGVLELAYVAAAAAVVAAVAARRRLARVIRAVFARVAVAKRGR